MPAKKPTILVADDDVHLLKFVVHSLQLEGYNALTASDGREALELMKEQPPDLVLLDLMMPEMDGFTVCSAIREFSAVPIIILTARGQDRDKVRGFDLGADDYLTKPFSVEELLARVRAVLRRAQFTINEHVHALQTIMTVGDISINDAEHSVLIAGREVLLTPIEYHLLFYLAQHAGRVVPQDQLLGYVWGDEYAGEGHLLQVNMSRLRSKIEADPTHPGYLLTKVGVGYMFAAPVSVPTA
jgi:DNA-binding response OmpR family regulator